MSKQYIENLLKAALQQLQQSGQLPSELPAIQVDTTKDKQHGDFATNLALILAKSAKCKPLVLANLIVEALPPSNQIKKIEIAGPGFINFFLTPDALYRVIFDITDQGEQYGRAEIGANKRIILEFVSSNPTGPLHVGHGRHGAYGSALANVLTAVGYEVHREYYINDAGRQMDILAMSVWLRYLLQCGAVLPFPANAYQGQYVLEMANKLFQQYGKTLFIAPFEILQNLPLDECDGGDKELYIDALIAQAKKLLTVEQYQLILELSLACILTDIREDLMEFGVVFDEWFSERAFAETEAVDETIQLLQAKQLTYEKEGALWFRSKELGDDKDRVLRRANGAATYFLNDLAYHVNKFVRGFDEAIDIFGADHHGYIPRMQAGLKAAGIPAGKLTYRLLQFVMLYRGGEPLPMSTRSGSFVTLRELRREVGNDAARFFYLARRCEQPVDFDLDLAKAKSNENPVYYIQYAYARIGSVFRQLSEKNLNYDSREGLRNLFLLKEPQELQLLSTLSRYPEIILNAASQHEVHLLTTYLRELAHEFHTYYNAHPFLVPDDALRQARLVLIAATRQVLANGLKLIGISTPDSM